MSAWRRLAFGIPAGACLLYAAVGCTSVAQITTLSDSRCHESLTGALSRILQSEGEAAPVARQLAESTADALYSYDLGPRPFLVGSPSGTDYSFFVEQEDTGCLLRLYERQKGFVSYTNNITYIATEPLAPCQCSDAGTPFPEAQPPATPRMIVVNSEDATFVPIDPEHPEDAQIAVLRGDPDTGPSSMLMKMRKAPGELHYHTADYELVLIEGRMKHRAEGQTEEQAPVLGPGSYWYQPGMRNHADSCLSDVCVMFITWAGKRDAIAAPEKPASGSGSSMSEDKLRDFGTRYTAAWCSQDPSRVAGFFAEQGSLKINAGAPSVGRGAITEAARGFMSAFPDMVVTMDGVGVEEDRVVYRWTLTGTNTGPGGTGRAVRIRGYEEWRLGSDGLIAESKGHFDEADYDRQLGAR
jgi:hypothetical protein